MSGGGGGIIIIRNLVRAAADCDSIKDALPPAQRARLLTILQKQVEDWTDDEFHFVVRCVVYAHDEQC